LAVDAPFAVHFHLHPAVACARGAKEGTADLTLRDGQRWRFTADGAQLSIEESIHYADLSGPRPSLQLVLRGACFGENEVRWSMERFAPQGGEASPSEGAAPGN